MSVVSVLLLVGGGALLIGGAEALVRGAARLAVSAGISPLVVGLTVVAFGTNSPELAVGILAAARGDADIVVGNVVGSNIFNILFILGLAALVAPLVVAQRLVRFEVPLMIALSAMVFLLALDGRLSRAEGALLLAGMVAYVAWAILQSRRETRAVVMEYELEFSARDTATPAIALDIVLVVAGLALLVLGSEIFVDGAVDIAEGLGVDPLVIALTIVAAGTSLPEVATSVLASLRGERDIAVGNAVGSNILNLLAVLGMSALVAEGGVRVADAAIRFDIPVMTAVAVATLPIFFTGWHIARWEGSLFLLYYAAYSLYLLLDASGHAALGVYSVAMLGFVLPITALTLGLLALRAFRDGRRQPG
jgi:cation:H+ antiporter